MIPRAEESVFLLAATKRNLLFEVACDDTRALGIDAEFLSGLRVPRESQWGTCSSSRSSLTTLTENLPDLLIEICQS